MAVVFGHGRITVPNDFCDNRKRHPRVGAERHERMPERMKTVSVRRNLVPSKRFGLEIGVIINRFLPQNALSNSY